MNARSFANHWPVDQYQLIDFGQGRKLERFGEVILDRPSPAALHTQRRNLAAWTQASIRLSDQESASSISGYATHQPQPWRVKFDEVQFELRLTPFGHVGLFPEHAAQWRWLLEAQQKLKLESPSILNLFAYTGGASLVLARHGWQVTHVDASEPTVQWARQNANLSGLGDAPVRWLVEDARLYVARELKRGRRYDAILLDPPSYGHGPTGKVWQIDRDLVPLIEQCCQLLTPRGILVLTGHSESLPIRQAELTDLRQELGHNKSIIEFDRVSMCDEAGRALDFGWSLRSAVLDNE